MFTALESSGGKQFKVLMLISLSSKLEEKKNTSLVSERDE